jgi:hypothetical protein
MPVNVLLIRALLSFYFHGYNGADLGASHQIGRTGIVLKLIDLFGHLDAHQYLDVGMTGVFC